MTILEAPQHGYPTEILTTPAANPPPVAAVEAINISQYAGGSQTLHNISLRVQPGEVVAIAGGSGAGKSTLLAAIAGIRPPAEGQVFIEGRPVADAAPGYVPQDDIIHLEMPLGRTLRHAAKLRLPKGTTSEMIDRSVDRVLEQLHLSDRADLAVRSLSGGQRKRASIATELLTDPRVLLLDEPTSGLDPATGATVLRQLRELAKAGTAVILTTHAPADLAVCDRVVFLAKDGHVAYVGPPQQAPAHFGVDRLVEVYERLAEIPVEELTAIEFATAAPTVDPVGHRAVDPTVGQVVAGPRVEARTSDDRTAGPFRQFRALVVRNFELLTRNRLTLSILLGSPVMVVGMMAVLFRPGSFGPEALGSGPAVQTLFWVAFASFFFGVTYGLLQVVVEFEIFRRERYAGLSIPAYVASKLAVLAPLLIIVNGVMLGVLRYLDRLPAASVQSWSEIMISAVLISAAAVSMGLCASALVQNTGQATLALPMLCFPQVLFAGAVVPTAEMTGVGRAMSLWQADRWGFESLGRSFDLLPMVELDPTAVGYSGAFTGSPTSGWAVMAVIIVISLVGTAVALDRRTVSGRG